MGILINVYRNAANNYDCTNGGVSSQFDTLCLTNIEGPFEPSDDRPACKLIVDEIMNRTRLRIVPDCVKDKWTMFGGNFAATSDSRVREYVENQTGRELFVDAIPIHDRVE